MNELALVLDLLQFALGASSKIEGLVADEERRSIEERIARARAAIADPIDPSEDDAARRARLERILRGEG
jgi:hypothetical protein